MPRKEKTSSEGDLPLPVVDAPLTWRLLLHTLAGAWQRFSLAGGIRSGAAVAFYAAFSVAPLLVVITGIMTWFYGSETAQHALLESLKQLIGQRETLTIGKILAQTAVAPSEDGRATVWASALALGTTLIGATGVFIELRGALQGMLERQEEPWSWWSLVRIRLLAVGVVLGCGFLMTVALVAQTLALSAITWLAARWPVVASLVAAFELIWSWCVITVLFTIIIRWLPAKRLPRRAALAGAALAASLFMLGRYGISLYVASTVIHSPLGAASSFAALLVWFFWSSQIFLLGAALAAQVGDAAQTQKMEEEQNKLLGNTPLSAGFLG